MISRALKGKQKPTDDDLYKIGENGRGSGEIMDTCLLGLLDATTWGLAQALRYERVD
jgi:hypothetical protein